MISKVLLFPYYITLYIRNRWYDRHPEKAWQSEIPVISIGNITVGGTGKTPVTEMAVEMLRNKYKVAVVSLGYRRKSKGFVLVGETDSALRVGDEPLQIKRKFPELMVAVDKDRRRAIKQLMAMPREVRPDVVLLDDGFQYRRLGHRKDIVLMDYNRPIFGDELLPIGRLRDLPSQIKRADTVIITKSPAYLDGWERDKMKLLAKVRPSQRLFFSTVNYCTPKPVFPECGDMRYTYSKEVYFFSGIACDKPVILYLTTKYDQIYHKSFSDHHKFRKADIRRLRRFAEHHPRTLLMTTEKDAMRLMACTNVPDCIKLRTFYLPIKAEILTDEEKSMFKDYLVEGLSSTNSSMKKGLLF